MATRTVSESPSPGEAPAIRTDGLTRTFGSFTAVDRLVKCMGPNQPWALFLTENLKDLAEKQPFDVIMLDQRIPQELWRQEERR